MLTLSQITLSSALLLLTLLFGYWLNSKGRPYNGLVFTIHKLAALGGVIVVTWRLTNSLQQNPPGSVILLLALAIICVITLFATGALMSMEKSNYAITNRIHQVAWAILVIEYVFGIYQFLFVI